MGKNKHLLPTWRDVQIVAANMQRKGKADDHEENIEDHSYKHNHKQGQ